jgi:hypothetical protein
MGRVDVRALDAEGAFLVGIWVLGPYLLLFDLCTPTGRWDLEVERWPKVILPLYTSGALGGDM